MGDSGSLFLGFFLSVSSIMLTQDPQYHVEPMYPMLVLLVPIFDTLRVMGLRVFSGKNPFKADTNHLHHLLLRAGFSPKKSVLLLWSLTAALGLAASLIHFRGTSTPYLIVVAHRLHLPEPFRRFTRRESGQGRPNRFFVPSASFFVSKINMDGIDETDERDELRASVFVLRASSMQIRRMRWSRSVN